MKAALFSIAILLCGCRQSRPTPASVEFTAERGENTIVFHWRPSDGVASRVRSGQINITDGGHRESIPLDRGTIAHGSVAYAAASDDVRADLEIELDGAPRLHESLRLLDARSVPAAAPAAAQADPPSPPPSAGAGAGLEPPDFRLPPRNPRQIAAPAGPLKASAGGSRRRR